jgi:Raf kinase inhibitor-like YbhB/YbcL family protein
MRDILMQVLVIVFISVMTLSISGSASTSETPQFTLRSSAFADGQTIPTKYTYNLHGQCTGQNYSPPLEWVNAPSGTKSFAIVCVDPDGRNWVHWVQFNIPFSATSLDAAVGGPSTGVKGHNDFGGLGYGGPCPPSGTHSYIFTLYAIDTTLSLPEGASKSQLEKTMFSHILGKSVLTGIRSR